MMRAYRESHVAQEDTPNERNRIAMISSSIVVVVEEEEEVVVVVG